MFIVRHTGTRNEHLQRKHAVTFKSLRIRAIRAEVFGSSDQINVSDQTQAKDFPKGVHSKNCVK